MKLITESRIFSCVVKSGGLGVGVGVVGNGEVGVGETVGSGEGVGVGEAFWERSCVMA